MARNTCKDCGGALITKEDDAGEFDVCADCGLRQDGLGQLQKRIGIGF
jgi:DNA-directed RNA polymerase subunit M/transcription elongation factor TFIIS